MTIKSLLQNRHIAMTACLRQQSEPKNSSEKCHSAVGRFQKLKLSIEFLSCCTSIAELWIGVAIVTEGT